MSPAAGSSAGSRTIVGVARPVPPARGGATIVGMAPGQPDPSLPAPAPGPTAAKAGAGAGQTIIGFAGPAQPVPAVVSKPANGANGSAQGGAGPTLLGVARPGIAPSAAEPPPRVAAPEARHAAEPAHELGATIGPLPDFAKARETDQGLKRRRIILPAPAPGRRAKAAKKAEEVRARRALALVIAGGVLALVAVLVAVLWPSPPPVLARARADGAGHEGVELTCKSCPDGTKLTVGGASAVTAGGLALVPLAAPLSVGENRLRVSIDRPANGRDELVNVVVNVGYRIRPELSSLQAERPSFQIVAEVALNTTVSIDGRKMTLSAGRGVENIDVTDDCIGLSGEMKTLSRQVPYVVTPESGPPEQGVVNVAVGIVPLRLEAPVPIGALAPHVVTDSASFVLAGSTLKGAEVLAAGRPITVHADGTFAQVMNVSSVGATQIEVRARMPGMAPRLTQIRVRRVESLEKAAREFAASEPPVAFADLQANVAGAVGKPVILSGEVSESKKQSYSTVTLLDVAASSGCAGADPCTVRLVQAGDSGVKRGDVLRVFGHVARAFSLGDAPKPPGGRAGIAEIEVDFVLKGDAAKDRR